MTWWDDDYTEADYLGDMEDWTEDSYCSPPFDPHDKGHRGKGNVKAHRRRKRMREQRLENQIGQYLIVADKGYKTLYLQDPAFSKRGYWTQFQSNARRFETKESAEDVLKNFKLGNPRIIFIDKNPVDTTPRSKHVCDHCKFYENKICQKDGLEKKYWYRCEQFDSNTSVSRTNTI
jgi:hypothetical protein